MHVRQLRAVGFRRFSDLTIRIGGTPKLVVLCGPNGSGKSSVFDAMRFWHGVTGQVAWDPEQDYWVRGDGQLVAELAQLTFHEGQPAHGSREAKKAVHIRTAYRNDPAFQITELRRAGELLEAPMQTARRLIDNDVRVTENYQRLVALTLSDVYGGDGDQETIAELRERYVGDLREAMTRLFPDLRLIGPGDPLGNGTFRFEKGAVADFAYKNLSGGEKAAFDLLLDLTVKRTAYDDTVFCIDEPEAHLNTRVQGDLLTELVRLIDDRSQLWIATHSIGMLRRAQQLLEDDPDSVVFLDFQDRDYDQPQVVEPTQLGRDFWQKTLDVALGDLGALVGPDRVVLCEGKPLAGNQARAEFDARCFRRIFGSDLPGTQFVSVGNSLDVETDQLRVGAAIAAVVSGTTVIRVVDRDLRSAAEVAELERSGVRVLRRRHLEAFLLDDEVITALCAVVGRDHQVQEAVAVKEAALAASVQRGNDPDDVKAAAGQTYTGLRQLLGLQQAGNSTEAFLADTMAPLLRPGMVVYEELREDIFG